jgi:hypothetical protein
MRFIPAIEFEFAALVDTGWRCDLQPTQETKDLKEFKNGS